MLPVAALVLAGAISKIVLFLIAIGVVIGVVLAMVFMRRRV